MSQQVHPNRANYNDWLVVALIVVIVAGAVLAGWI